MPDLSGNLGFMPCRDLFRYLGNRRLSGTLTTRRGSVEKRVVLHEGTAVSAASTDPREYLGQILINGGHLTEDQFNRAYQTQIETGVPLGQILTMIGLVGEEEVRRALSVKIRETALELCDWRSGDFEFSAHAPTLQGGVPYAVPLLDIWQESEQRVRTWTAMRRLLPSGDTRLELVPGSRPKVEPGSPEARLFELLAEGHSIDEMVLDLHATEYALYQRLYALVQEGVVRFQSEDGPSELPESWFPEQTPPPRRAPQATPGELVQKARAALLSGDAAEAAELAARALDRAPDPAASDLLKQAEAKLLVELRGELLATKRVPLLSVERNQVKGMPLTPPERYLLARMDGTRDLGSIVRVSPLRELDALRLVKRFAGDGMIRFA